MTKRGLERDVEKLGEELLTELEPADRGRYIFEAQAQDKDHWVERLFETCPPEQVVETLAWGQLALLFAFDAVYDLHTIALQFELYKTLQDARAISDIDRDEISEERLERSADLAENTRTQFATLYIAYHGNRRFAEEGLGVEFETWVSFHKNGPLVIELAENTLDNPSQQRLAEEWITEDAEISLGESEADPLDALVDNWYENQVQEWQRTLAEIYEL